MKYNGQTSTEIASIETGKLLINSVLSTKDAKFMAKDISNFYIPTVLEDYQYIRFPINMIPQDIIDKYNLIIIVNEDGYCYAEISKAMYRLQESGYLANIELKRILGLEGYTPSKCTPGLFICTQNKRYSLFISSG